MKRIFTSLTLVFLFCCAAFAATTNTTLTVDASGALSGTSFTATGTATMPNVFTGNGTFSATVSLSSMTGGSSTMDIPFTITAPGSAGTITGKISLPISALAGTSATAPATITGGTGSFAGASGSFSLQGTASMGTTLTIHFSGPGSITTGGSSGGTGTGGGGGTTTGPTITDVLDAGSYTKNIAQGSIFVVKGSNLSASGYTAMSFPLPTSSSGVKITFTPAAGGQGTDAYLIYLYNQSGVNQLAGLLPSTVAPGNYNVTVTNGTTSAGFATTVVQRKPGIITQDSSGSGLAVVQNYISAGQLDVDRFTSGSVSGVTISPARPGQVLIAWLTGLGPVTGSENTASPGVDFSGNTDIQVLVGGKSVKPLYAGRAPGLAGADQINFILPTDVQTGCTVPFQVSVAGQLSNQAFLAIAPDASSSACVAPGFTTQQLQDFDQGKTMTFGAFTISQMSTSFQGQTFKVDTAGGAFTKITGFQLANAGRYTGTASNGCQVIHVKGNQSQLINPVSASNLDAGNITLTGPSGTGISALALTKDSSNSYAAALGTEGFTIPGQASVTLLPGTYTLNGAGGTQVGAFSASVNMASPLNVTGGLPATVNRASGLNLAWTGGGANDLVMIMGYSGTSSGTGQNITVDATEFICTTTAGQGGFTVPSSVLSQLPATNGSDMTGFLMVFSSGTPANFNAPLVGGGNVPSTFSASTGTGAQASYQ